MLYTCIPSVGNQLVDQERMKPVGDFHYWIIAFSALKLLVGWQKEHPACRKPAAVATVVLFWGMWPSWRTHEKKTSLAKASVEFWYIFTDPRNIKCNRFATFVTASSSCDCSVVGLIDLFERCSYLVPCRSHFCDRMLSNLMSLKCNKNCYTNSVHEIENVTLWLLVLHFNNKVVITLGSVCILLAYMVCGGCVLDLYLAFLCSICICSSGTCYISIDSSNNIVWQIACFIAAEVRCSVL